MRTNSRTDLLKTVRSQVCKFLLENFGQLARKLSDLVIRSIVFFTVCPDLPDIRSEFKSVRIDFVFQVTLPPTKF
jgi:hypothetical protein